MSTPDASAADASVQTPPRTERAPLLRSRDGVVAGVCSGLARHLGADVWTVRYVMLGAVLVAGAGLFLYAWLWVLVPTEGDAHRTERTLGASRRRTLAEAMRGLPRGSFRDADTTRALRTVLVGAACLIAGLLLVGQLAGMDLAWNLLWPLVLVTAGAVLAWSQLDAGSAHVAAEDADKVATPRYRWLLGARLIAGLALVVAGLIWFVASGVRVEAIWAGMLVSLVTLVGIVVVLLPWGLKLWRNYQTERASRIRAAERADIAAHLHDSVLQTLALIQKRASDEAHVIRLARAQERELRQWLYQDAPSDTTNLGDAIRKEAADLEAHYAAQFDVVTVGQAEGVAGQEALVQAAREAMVNAAKHAGGAVSVYVEQGGGEISVFVRDRGKGFDVERIAEDRLGVRESILGRMKRHGGSARIRSSEDGTEVQLFLPLETKDENREDA